jgi:hypothetical protein
METILKTRAQCWARSGPRLQPTGVETCHAQWLDSRVGLSLAARSSGENSPRRCATACSRRGHRAIAGSPVAASRRQGATGEHAEATGRTPGKEEGAGTHQKGGSTARRRKQHRATAFNDGGVAPMVVDVCGEVLQLEGDKGVRRGWLIKKNRGSGRRSPMKADGGAIRVKSCAGQSPPVTVE